MGYRSAARVQESSITTGTGTYTLDGAPVGFQSFSVMGGGNYCEYYVTDGTDWEEGLGTILTGPNRLERTHVLASSNAGAAVNWPAGTRTLRNAPIGATFVPRYLSKSIAGNGTLALTPNEQRVACIEFTGALTGARVIEVDDSPWLWTIYNATSGAFSLTVKVAGQTGVVLEQGRRHVVYCDGVDVRRGAVAASGDSEFAAGTLMLFHQSTAPVGWSKQSTHNDKALRVVSGSVGSGGATAFTSVFGAAKSTFPHAITIAQMPVHSHPARGGNTAIGTSSSGTTANTEGLGFTVETDNRGGGEQHSHDLSLDLQYVDVIIAQKA